MEAISNLIERQGMFGSKIFVECLKCFMVHTTGLSAFFFTVINQSSLMLSLIFFHSTLFYDGFNDSGPE